MIFYGIRIYRTRIPEYYYHVTRRRWGNLVTLKPRSDGYNRALEEPDIARICVGPSVAYCLASTIVPKRGLNVYRTKSRVLGYYPIEVMDSRYTREKWLLHPTDFVRVGYVPWSVIKEIRSEHSDGSDNDYLKGKVAKVQGILKRNNCPEYPNCG